MRILVVDDENGIRTLLSRIFSAEGHDVTTAANGIEALSILENIHVDLVLSDVRMPQMDGLELLRAHVARGGSAPFVIMSAFGDDDAAIEAIRNGAHDYLNKPFQAEHVLLVLRKVIERERLRSNVRVLSEELSLVRSEEDVIGRSEAIRRIVSTAQRAARHHSPVLVTGEAGTGKELIARLMHRNGPHFDSAFLAVDCAVPSESFLSGELFVPVEPALADVASRPPFGTVFLDDIDALSPENQARLAAMLRGGVGSGTQLDTRGFGTRVIAATTTDLAGGVANGKFRSDLYYALCVIQVHIPPLRERKADVPDLVLYFAGTHARRLQVAVPRFSSASLRALGEYEWPGNVRELENVVERALILCDAEEVRLELVEWILRGRQGDEGPVSDKEDLSIKRQTAALEKRLIAIALDRCHGNRIKAAKVLELSHRALLYKIKEYEL